MFPLLTQLPSNLFVISLSIPSLSEFRVLLLLFVRLISIPSLFLITRVKKRLKSLNSSSQLQKILYTTGKTNFKIIFLVVFINSNAVHISF